MKERRQLTSPRSKTLIPLFSSPWLALFLLIRREIRLARQS